MRNVLIVSPRFPPVSTPDVHRVRTSLPYFEAFGWRPLVLAVEPGACEGAQEELLTATVPESVPVHRTRALPARWTRKLGVGDVGIRALPYLYRAGADLIGRESIDLVYFSTTAFHTLTLGRLWRARHGAPFVVDLQDPWYNEFPSAGVDSGGGLKHRAARRLHRSLERWTMRAVGGLIAVSPAYLETLDRRHPWLAGRPRAVLPFGAEPHDFELARARPRAAPLFDAGDGRVHGVYVGRAGHHMGRALRLLFSALGRGRAGGGALSRVALHFIGTDYAPPERARSTVRPVAEETGVADAVEERPARVPYFAALQLLCDADFLLVLGTDDPSYSASKLLPYVLARKPLLAILHEDSPACALLRETRAGSLVTFGAPETVGSSVPPLLDAWKRLLDDRSPPATDWSAVERWSARALTARQCALFDAVLDGARAEDVP